MHQANKSYKIFPLRQQRALTKPSLSPQIGGPILLIVKSCNAFYVKQQTSNVITNVSTEERSKEERSESKHKLENTEESVSWRAWKRRRTHRRTSQSCQILAWKSPITLRTNSHPWNNLKRWQREILMRR